MRRRSPRPFSPQFRHTTAALADVCALAYPNGSGCRVIEMSADLVDDFAHALSPASARPTRAPSSWAPDLTRLAPIHGCRPVQKSGATSILVCSAPPIVARHAGPRSIANMRTATFAVITRWFSARFRLKMSGIAFLMRTGGLSELIASCEFMLPDTAARHPASGLYCAQRQCPYAQYLRCAETVSVRTVFTVRRDSEKWRRSLCTAKQPWIRR